MIIDAAPLQVDLPIDHVAEVLETVGCDLRWWTIAETTDVGWRLSCRWPGLPTTEVRVEPERLDETTTHLLLRAVTPGWVRRDRDGAYVVLLEQLIRELVLGFDRLRPVVHASPGPSSQVSAHSG